MVVPDNSQILQRLDPPMEAKVPTMFGPVQVSSFSFINRSGKAIRGIIEHRDTAIKLAFIAHGLSGFKEQAHIRALAQSFLSREFNVVTYDASNSFGESDGRLEDSTFTTHHADLEDTIAWSSSQPWYKEPFGLVGHSLGSAAILKFTIENPTKVSMLAPSSAITSGAFYRQALSTYSPELLSAWRTQGYLDKESPERPEKRGRLSWRFIEDLDQYDLLEKANKLPHPMLLVVGSLDPTTPVDQQRLLQGSGRPLHVIGEAPHTFRMPEHLVRLELLTTEWLDSLNT